MWTTSDIQDFSLVHHTFSAYEGTEQGSVRMPQTMKVIPNATLSLADTTCRGDRFPSLCLTACAAKHYHKVWCNSCDVEASISLGYTQICAWSWSEDVFTSFAVDNVIHVIYWFSSTSVVIRTMPCYAANANLLWLHRHLLARHWRHRIQQLLGELYVTTPG